MCCSPHVLTLPQDLAFLSEAAAFLKAVKDEDKTLEELNNVQLNIEKNLKFMKTFCSS